MRRAVAERYGCGPGETRRIVCHWCNDWIIIDRTNPRRTYFLDVNGYSWPELDHVIPLSRGGPHTADNLVPSCISCNRAKHAAIWE